MRWGHGLDYFILLNVILFICYIEETFLKDKVYNALLEHLSLTETWVFVDV